MNKSCSLLDSLKSPHQLRVEDFMRKAGQTVPHLPLLSMDDETRKLRAKLLFEEVVLELISRGLGVNIRIEGPGFLFNLKELVSEKDWKVSYEVEGRADYTEIIDGCCDTSVVNIGTLSCLGIPDNPFLREVDENNLKKFGEGGYRDPLSGKWIKPKDHQPPDIYGVMSRLIVLSNSGALS